MNNDKVNLLLPKDSKLSLEDKTLNVTSLRIKKMKATKDFKIQVLNGKKKVFETFLKSMSLKIKSGESFMILEVTNNKETILHITSKKILPDLEMKRYIKTLII